MDKKILMLIVTALLLLSVMQPLMAAKASAAWQPFGQALGDLRLQRTKAVVTAGIEASINGLRASEGGIERSKLTDGQKAALEAQVESNITWLEGKKQDVQSAGDVAGVLQNAKQARERWNEAYPGLKKELGLMACDNFDAELGRARSAAAIVSSRIAAQKAQGKDTAALESSLASYNGHVDSASQDVANARSDFDGIRAPNDGSFAAGLKQLGAADKEAKGAYADLKAIYRGLLGDGGQAA